MSCNKFECVDFNEEECMRFGDICISSCYCQSNCNECINSYPNCGCRVIKDVKHSNIKSNL